MNHVLSILLTTFLLGSSAQAGPWLRDDKSVFTAVSITAEAHDIIVSQTYIEYGFSPNTTLIADVSVGQNLAMVHHGSVTLSYRRALSSPQAENKWAYELGLGASWEDADAAPHIRANLGWGRGLRWRGQSGWTNIEASFLLDASPQQHSAKLDATVGLDITDTTTAMLQLYSAYRGGADTYTFAPSIIWSPLKNDLRLQIGLESPIAAEGETAIKLGLWRSF